MDTAVIEPIVRAAGPLLAKVLELFANGPGKDQDSAEKTISKVYDTLKANLAGNCITILRMLEFGSLLYPTMIRERLYPDLRLNATARERLDAELRYRMEYMRLNGVVSSSGTEYGISKLGVAFLAEARRRRDYPEQLAP